MKVHTTHFKVTVSPDVTIFFRWDEFPENGSTQPLTAKWRQAMDVLRNKLDVTAA